MANSQINFLKLNAQETNVNILISNNILNCRTYFRCKDANKFEASNQHALYSFSFQTNNNILSPNFFINQAGINQADQSLEPLVCLNVCFWKVFPVCLIFLYWNIDTIFYVQLDIVYMNREWTKRIAEEKISSNEESWAKNGPCYNSRISLARLKSSLSLSICFRPDSGESCSGHFSCLQKEICNGMSASPRQKSYRMWNSFKHNEIKFECLIF